MIVLPLINIKPAISQRVQASKKIKKSPRNRPQLSLSSISASILFRNSPVEEQGWLLGCWAAGLLGYHQLWFTCRFQFIHSSRTLSSF